MTDPFSFLKPAESMGRRKVVFVIVFLFVMIVAGVVIPYYAFKPATNLTSAGIQAGQLIAKAGGPAKVCDEANQMFKDFKVSDFKVSNVKFFHYPSELKDYPAIAALGTPDRISIYSGPDSHIAIRVGTHLDGFMIEIADTNGPGKYFKSSGTLELVDSRIFVHR